jgi:hypothetical protein
MDQHGLVLASPTEAVYSHAATWAPDGSATVSFARRENVRLVACGEEWFAVATSAPCVRIFTSAGMELAVLMLPVNVVVMVGRENLLFYAFGKDLAFSVIDIPSRREVAHGTMSVAQPLRWVGIAMDLSVVCVDYADIAHKLARDFHWQWVPVCQLEKSYDHETTGFWCVYAGEELLYGVPLRATKSPATYPLPACKHLTLTPQTFAPSLRPWLTLQMGASLGHRISAKQKDRELIKLLPVALKEEQELRAVEIARLLKTKQVREFVVPFVDRQGVPRVGDHLTGTVRQQTRNVPSVRWRALPGAEGVRKGPVLRTNSEETIYVRPVTAATEHSAEVGSKPGGLMEVLQSLGKSKAAFQAEETGEKEKRKGKNRKRKTWLECRQRWVVGERRREAMNTSSHSFSEIDCGQLTCLEDFLDARSPAQPARTRVADAIQPTTTAFTRTTFGSGS